MHPRIRARNLAVLEAKRAKARDQGALLATDLKATLIETAALLDRHARSDKMKVPGFFPSAYKALQRKVAALDLQSTSSLEEARAIRSELAIVNDLLAAHFSIADARSELAHRAQSSLRR